ncbi:hypothetical protein QTP70_027601, partial [Hemibagrus guttatus]
SVEARLPDWPDWVGASMGTQCNTVLEGPMNGILTCEERPGVSLGSPAVCPLPTPGDSRRHGVTAVSDWTGLDEDEDAHVWEDNWDDDNVEDDFSNQLRAELEKHGYKMETS